MIRRILLLKFVSWCVLAPVLALAPTQHLRFGEMPHLSHPLRKWALRSPHPTGLIGSRRGFYALSHHAHMQRTQRWRGRFVGESGDIFASPTTA